MSSFPASNPHKICYVFAGYSKEDDTVTMTKLPCLEMTDQSGKSFFVPKVEGSSKRAAALADGVKWEDALQMAGRSYVSAQKVTLTLSQAFNMPTWEDMGPNERRGALYTPVLTRAEKARMQESVGTTNVVTMKLAANG